MGSYKIQLLKSADRDIRKIDKQQIKRILAAIWALSDEPFDIAPKKWTQSYAHFLYCIFSYSAGLWYSSVA